jgi:hypothetical protein
MKIIETLYGHSATGTFNKQVLFLFNIVYHTVPSERQSREVAYWWRNEPRPWPTKYILTWVIKYTFVRSIYYQLIIINKT